MGVNTVEREGLSFSHPAAFVLVGTMNPEEGDLRPQLLDRFALAVDVAGMPDPAQRAEVVRRRIAYEADPLAFAQRWSNAQSAERSHVFAARALLPDVRLADALLDLIARIATEFEVDGLRADIVMYRAAVTLAAYHARREVTPTMSNKRLSWRCRTAARQPFEITAWTASGSTGSSTTSLHRTNPMNQDRRKPPTRHSISSPSNSVHLRHPSRARHSLRAPYRTSPDRRSISIESHTVATSAACPCAWRNRAHWMSRQRYSPPLPTSVRGVTFTMAPTGRSASSNACASKTTPQRAGRCTLFAVDASGSMAAKRRMAAAKGAVVALYSRPISSATKSG